MKSINMYIWVVCTSNKVFRSSSYTKTNIFQKTKQLLAKLRSWQQVHFVLPILFVLTFASGLAVLCENVALLILVLSSKKTCSSFVKKVFVFHKFCFKVNVGKTLKISIGCHINKLANLSTNLLISQTKGYFENLQYRFQKTPCFLLSLRLNLYDKVFFYVKTKTNPNFAMKAADI